MPATLRAATGADAIEVAGVYLDSRKTFLPFAPLAHSDAEVCDWIAGKLIPSGRVLVAEDQSRIVGMMATSIGREASWIDQLYLSPGAVGEGLGTRMLEVALGSLTPPIRLYTFQQNTGARRFYERHGFRVVQMSDGMENEEKCPDVLYEFTHGETMVS